MKHYTLNRQLVAELREQRGISQPDLAKRVGVSGGFMSQLESGLRQPSAAIALKIADTLGVGFADITISTRNAAQAAS